MGTGLKRLMEEDPSFVLENNIETHQTLIGGQGDIQLNIMKDKLKDKFGVDVNTVPQKIAYRETIKGTSDVQGKHKKQTGGAGQYGDVWIRFFPNPGKGFEFEDQTVGGSVPKEFIRPTQQGLEEALNNGLVAGYPVVDIKAVLFDGSYHDVDSSEQAYKIAASLALKEAAKICDPAILEPVMAVDITAPAEYLGAVMGDVTKRRGQIREQEETGNAIKVKAFIPLANMFGYVTDLRSFTQGRGTYMMTMDHYEEVPKNIAKEIIEKNTTGASK
jgi:elongation factor G